MPSITVRSFLLSGFVILALLTSITAVSAQEGWLDPEAEEMTSLATPKTCDNNNPPKYYCTWIRYVAAPNGIDWELRKRLYKGARDGGAVEWQLWYAKDWWWDGSQWVWIRTAPSSNWFNNIIWDRKRNAGSIVTIQHDAAVTMRLRYKECDPNNPSNCWFWCSLITQHNLNGRTSQQFGNGRCAGDGPGALILPQ